MALGIDILDIEVAAARIEAVLNHDPSIGRLWRAESAIVEAVRSVGLEDIRIRESDLLMRMSENATVDIDARGVESAYATLRGLNRAGATRDPAGLILSIETQVMAEIDQTYGAVSLTRAELDEILALGRAPCLSPLIGALRSSARYALITERQSPMLERLVFSIVEAGLRSAPEDTPDREDISDNQDQDDVYLDQLMEPAPTGGWIMLPATALTTNGFSLWQPTSLEGVERLVAGLRHSLAREIGRIGPIRAWLEKADHLSGTYRKGSRFPDLVTAITRRPLITSARLTHDIGVAPRTATNLLNEAVAHGLLVELKMRRYARIWSTPGLATLLTDGARPRHAAQPVTPSGPAATISDLKDTIGPEAPDRQPAPAKDMEEAYSEFDALMAEADEMLAKIGATRREREEKLGLSL